MTLWLTIILCFIIIFLIDKLIHYLKDNYTTKKTKDIVGIHIQKYQNLINEYQKNTEKEKQALSEQSEKKIENEIKLTNEDLLTIDDELNNLITNDL
jgi:predicted Holliday junction resolvase-like endonuclease